MEAARTKQSVCKKSRKEEEEENQNMENSLINAILAGEPRDTDAAEGGVTRKVACVAQSTKAREGSFQ